MVIGDGIVLGYGGGEIASILVTGLSQTDTVTATKNGKTVFGKWTQIPNPDYVVPDGYTQLAYVEGTGTQYIDTGVVLNANTYAQTRQVIIEKSAWGSGWYINGVGTSGRCWFSGALDGKIYYASGYANQATSATLIANTKVQFDLDFPNSTYQVSDLTNNTIRLSLTSLAKQAPSSAYTLWLFGFNGDKGLHSGQIISAKYYQSGVLIRDFVPAKRNSDSSVGMYDLVTNTFYGNNGTGTFTAGSEVQKKTEGFLIEPIKSYGAWTVTNGNGTKTAEVLIDAAVEFEVTL